jgi:4-hydroxy-tetrahydrodipicolinate reductase
MKIALIGYGKMGKEIEAVAQQRGHEVVLHITSTNAEKLKDGSLATADAAIEFTRPDSAYANVSACFEAHVPVVCGTTGWNIDLEKARKLCFEKDGAFLAASNFSVGVNLFFEVNKKLAALMELQPSYDVRIVETHHVQKKDAPSGTAITIAEEIMEHVTRKKSWVLDGMAPEQLAINAIREEGVPGTHEVIYSSPIDDIALVHTAHNRQGFATGAVLAAEFLYGKKGVYTMKDVLGF